MALVQRSLFDVERGREAFDAFVSAHPDVLTLFERFARELRAAGFERAGARAIVERIRWHYATTSSPVVDASGRRRGFKVNNNFTPHFARWLIERDPSFEEFFEVRRLKG